MEVDNYFLGQVRSRGVLPEPHLKGDGVTGADCARWPIYGVFEWRRCVRCGPVQARYGGQRSVIYEGELVRLDDPVAMHAKWDVRYD